MDAKPTQAERSLFEIDSVVSAAYRNHLGNTDGALANYITELAAVDPDRFGIEVANEAGQLYTVGDTDHRFTIQSASKACVYCLAL